MRSLLILLIGFGNFLYGNCPVLDLPEKFLVRETVGSGLTPLVYDFEVLGEEDQVIARIGSRIFRTASTLELSSPEGELIATARAKYISWGTKIQIVDCQDNPIGRISEESVVGKRLLSLGSLQGYKFQDTSGNQVADVSKVDTSALTVLPFAGIVHKAGLGRNTLFSIKGRDGEPLFKISRSTIQLIRDTWEITRLQSSDLDPRVLVFLPAYRTRKDSVLRPETSNLKKKTNLFEALYQSPEN